MDTLTITVSNSNEQDCQRLTLIRHYKIPVTVDAKRFVLHAISEVEQEHRDLFPKSMTFVVPYTVVEITPDEVVYNRELHRASAEEAVR